VDGISPRTNTTQMPGPNHQSNLQQERLSAERGQPLNVSI